MHHKMSQTINYNKNTKLKDCIRNTNAVCNPRHNSVQDKIQTRQIQSETKFSPKKDNFSNCRKKFSD